MTQTLEQTIEETVTQLSYDHGDHERFAHYYDTSKYDIVESAFNETPIVAICGKVWIPSRDPQKFPVCPDCEYLAENVCKQ